MENKWRMVMMVLVMVVMAAIGGEAQDDSCETICAINCRDSLFHKQCLDRCFKACKDHPPPSQLHSPVMAKSPEGEQGSSTGCRLKCQFKCFVSSKCYKRCVRKCGGMRASSTIQNYMMKNRGVN